MGVAPSMGMSFDGTKADVKDLFNRFGDPMPEWVFDATPKQMENWNEHGSPIVAKLETDKARWWYLRLYRPKKRGSGMMERDHVEIGEPEHYLKKKVGGIKRPMGSIHGEVMASLGVDDETADELDDVATEIVKATTTEREKKRIAQQGERLAGVLGL